MHISEPQKNAKRQPLISSAVLLFIILAAIIVALSLIASYNALHWPALSMANVTTTHVIATLVAFFSIALMIERAGQVFIKLIQQNKREDAQAELETLRVQTQHEISANAAAATRENMERETAFATAPNNVPRPPSSPRLQPEKTVADMTDKQEELTKIEQHAAIISIKVALPLAILVSVSGVHFLESLMGPQTASHMLLTTTDFAALVDQAKLPEPPAKNATAAEIMKATKDSLKAQFESASSTPQVNLKTFRFIDMIITTLLLAGGSAGIRVLLDSLKGLTSKPQG